MNKIKILLFYFLFTSGIVIAQIPDWTATACNDSVQYTMYSELSNGKAVVLVFGNLWCGPSANLNLTASNLPQIGSIYGFGNPCVKIFNFIQEIQPGTPTTCDYINYFIYTKPQGTFNYPVFSNDGLPANPIFHEYDSLFSQAQMVSPLILVFIPNETSPELSTLVYNNYSGLGVSSQSGYENTFATDIMGILNSFDCLSSISENIQQYNESELEGIYDILGRKIKPEPNQLLIYKYKNGSQRKVFQINY
jgi:hypothetical protein